MNNIIDRLKQISGVGDILAERLAEEGFETYKSIARADEKELLKIDGIKENNIKNIQKDARRLEEAVKIAQENMLNALLQDADKLNDNIHLLVKHIRKKPPRFLRRKQPKLSARRSVVSWAGWIELKTICSTR